MLWLTRQSLKRASITILLAVVLMVAGLIATRSFRQELFPDISFPVVSVVTVYPGASAATMDEEVTALIEKAVSGVGGIEAIQSTSRESFAITVISFDVDRDPNEAKVEVQDKLSALSLPDGANDPSVGTFGFGALPILTASVSGDDLSVVQDKVEDEVIPVLSALPGVSNVSISGGQQAKLLIDLDPAKMQELGVTQCAVAQAIQANNTALPAGTVFDQNRTLQIRISGSYDTLEDVENIIVGVRGLAVGGGAGGATGGFGGGAGFPCVASLGSQPAPTATPQPTPTLVATPATEGVTATTFVLPPQLTALGITSPEEITPDVLAQFPPNALGLIDLNLALNLPAATQAALAEQLPPAEVPAQFANFGITSPEQLTPDVLANVPAPALLQFPLELVLALPVESQALIAVAAAEAAPAAPGNGSAPTAQLPAEFANFGITSPEQITPELIAQIPAEFLEVFTPELVELLPEASQQALAERQANPDAPAAPLEIPEERLIRLKDVAIVQVGTIGGNTITRTNGDPSLGLDITRDTTGNTVEIVAEAREIFDRIEAENPAINFTIVGEQATPVLESISAVTTEGIIGAIVAILVIFLFLRSVRSTLVTAISIPLSVLVALLLIRIQGFSLNVMTLGGLTVAVGRVVDDSIVVLENIYRHMRRGESINQAVLDGTREVAGAITSSTLTTVCVFLPLGLVGGIVSKFFLPFALTVSYALLASLLVSLTIVPLLARLFIRPKKEESNEDSWLQRLYTPLLEWSLRSWLTKSAVLATALILLIGSLALASQLKFTFLPDDSDKNIVVSLEMPAGTALEVTDEQTQAVEALLAPLKADGTIIDVQTIVGRGGSGQAEDPSGNTNATNQARITITVDNSQTDPLALAKDLEAQILALNTFEEVESRTVAADGGGPGGSGLDITLVGTDIDELREANRIIIDAIGGDKASDRYAVTNVASSLAEVKPELSVAIDPEAAIRSGSATALIGLQIRSLLDSQSAGRLELEGYDQPLETVVRVDFDRFDIETLGQIPVGTFRPTPLEEIATIEIVEGATSITRINGDRAASITGQFTSDDTINTQTQILNEIKALDLPEGVTVQAGAQAQSQTDTLANMGLALLVAVVLVYLVMVITFGSLSTPFVILFTLPLAIIGAILGLYLTSKPLGITSLIGVLMLIGIVVTNAIVLLELVEQYRERGMNLYDSIVRGGKVRLRPILMTALATMVALVPLALGLKKGGFIAADLAIVVIGGLFTSTFLTLLVIPVLYSIFEGVKGRFGGGDTHQEPSAEPPAEPLHEPA